MITEVRMPKLGMAMKKGTVTKWLSSEGDTVQEGADLFELATEKITAVVPAPAAGLLGRVVVDPGTELPVGALLALIGEPSDAFPPREELAGAPAAPAAAEAAPAGAAAAAAPAASPRGGGEGAPVSPAARRRARELGVDVTQVPPSAPGKRVKVEDVERFAAAAEAAPSEAAPAPEGQVVAFAGIRKVVAERLTESLRTMAQVTISREVDASGLVARRAALAAGFEAAAGVRLTYTDLLVETVARLLGDHPLLNATLTGQGIVVPPAVHMGVAVALEDGLIVPVVRDAGSRPLGELARDRADLAARAQAGTLTLDELEGGTFTISNLGSFGADAFTPIVNPPQCAILGVGRIVDKPAAVAGEVQVRPMMWLSLTFDHRIVDGAPAARFLQQLGDRLGAAG
ncbi:MAG TPA: dihydrolipoamide acetyltransferase family protein [Actinomycetes bacterium]|nr:dihydrolipoamide acetyltransferase family protein [Actinomycetes bacterium]